MADENNNIEQKISLTYDTNADAVAGEVQQLNTAIDNTTQSQNENNVATQKSEQNLKTFKTQLREANQELLKVSQTFGETSKEAVQAAKKVADLKDQMQFSKDLVDNFNPDQKFKALGAATQIATTATSGLVSGMALFGDQSEDTQKTLLKVQAAMAFSDAVSGLSNLGDQWKTLKTVIASSTIVTAANTAATTVATAATKLFGISAETTAVGFKVLKGAIIATGIGALGIAIVALVQNFDSIKKAVLNAIPGLSGVAETIGNIVQAVTDFVGATSEADRQLDLAKSKAKQQLELNKKYLQEHESQLNEVTKKKIEAKNKYLEVVAEEGKATAEFARETNRQLAKIDKEAQEEKDKKAKELAEKEAEKRKKEQEEAKKKAEEAKKLEEQRLKEFNEFQIAINNAEFEQRAINNENKQAQIDELNEITAKQSQEEELKRNKEIEDEKATVEAKIEIQNAQIDNVSKGISLLQSLGIKNKAIQKGLVIAENAAGIAKTVINTMAANAKAIAASPLTGGQPFVTANTISGAIGVATSVAATAKALSALGGGGGGSSSGTSLPSGGGGQSATPTVGFQTSSENQIATTIANNQQEQPPIKAFVVSTEVSTAQAIDRNKVTANSLGN
ncbi:MAG: hypothetical protein KAZ71_06145 [Bacteroidia bacterium]|nr:hypothetical protein [Bacteroidia bacterium]